ncbi:DUF3800 domain-containing protein [Agreia sp.]|uniref:DUF3800 domain-containing protein n=1 Tax=Agreia sp. TaxID=1872416 RepID=UPI0035BC5FE2
MLYAFIDESYTDERYYVAAFVIDEADFAKLTNAIKSSAQYAEGFGVTPGTEMHAYEMMSGRGGWEPLRGKTRAALAIYRNALKLIADLPGRMFIRGVDVTRLNARYSYPYPPHRICLQHVLEDVDEYAGRLGKQVVVIADEVQDQDAHAARAELYQTIGTGGYKSSRLSNISMPITFGSSAESPGLQTADLIVYLYRRLDAHVERDVRAKQAVERLWEILKPLRGVVWVWSP